MSLSVTSRAEQGFHILTVNGHLTLGPNLRTLQQAARGVFDASTPDGLIIDVNGVRYADSAGLGELTILYSLCNKKHCELVLAGVPNQLKQLLELTRLDALLPSAADIETAKRLIRSKSKKTAAGE